MKNGYELIRTANNKKYGEFNFYIRFDTVTNRWMLWQESTIEGGYRFEGIFTEFKTKNEIIDNINNLKYAKVGACKVTIH